MGLLQRLTCGAHLLRSSMRAMKVSRTEWALRTWSIASAKIAQADAGELIRKTAELNEQLLEHCRRSPLDGLINALVCSLRAAQTRQLLSAFVHLSTAVKATREGRSTAPAVATPPLVFANVLQQERELDLDLRATATSSGGFSGATGSLSMESL